MPPPTKPAAPSTSQTRRAQLFAGLFGAFLGLLLLKFGNPPIMEKWVTPPKDAYDFVLTYPWPISWAYLLLAALALFGLLNLRWPVPAPKWLLPLPLLWLIWQFAASAQSSDPGLSHLTVAHFTATAVCFYLGAISLRNATSLLPLCLGLLCGFLLVLAEGWQQHFGGLEATRKYFELYVYPQMKEVPPEYLKKLSSTRIFGTLFYPNALAGMLLLLLPALLTFLWQLKRKFTPAARAFLVAIIFLSALACLFWSGSKGGWLLMLLLGLITLLHLPFPRKYKLLLVSILLVAGLAGFFVKYASFFQKGATSVGARFDYWHAALRITAAHPLFGTGPGTFGTAYANIKRPESEPSRLTHNDYLQQAADSGVVGFLTYTVFILGCLVWSYPGLPTTAWSRPPAPSPDPEPFGNDHPSLRYAVWLGVLGWSLQGLMEFGLYIPALAWTAFAFLGWLVTQPPRPTNPPHLD